MLLCRSKSLFVGVYVFHCLCLLKLIINVNYLGSICHYWLHWCHPTIQPDCLHTHALHKTGKNILFSQWPFVVKKLIICCLCCSCNWTKNNCLSKFKRNVAIFFGSWVKAAIYVCLYTPWSCLLINIKKWDNSYNASFVLWVVSDM